jgi:probable HAF family extracellular repeat protein
MIIDVPGATQTRIHGINDTGQFVGDYNLNGTHGFIYSNGRYITLDFPNAIATRATGINNSGQIVGAYTSPTGKIYGFLASPKNTTGAIALLLLSD